MQKFIHKNESFICKYCKESNPPSQQTCRDHCRKCLCSQHVDIYPGDRLEKCHGKMIPTSVTIKSGNYTTIHYQCTQCDYTHNNKVDEDDDVEILRKFSRQPRYF